MAALIVGDQGQIIPYTKIKKWGIFLIFSLAASLFAVSGIGFMMLKKQSEITMLKESLGVLEKKTAQLKDEKELLMAKLVIAEAQLRPTGKKAAGEDKEGNEITSEPEKSIAVKNEKKTAQADKKKNNQETKSAAAKSAATPEPVIIRVLVDNVRVKFNSSRNIITASYVIRNKSSRRVPISGRTLMVLNHQELGADKWISLPKVPLSAGKPNGKKGARFKINNFKPFSLEISGPAAPFAFDNGTVFIFNKKGELIFEKDFPVSISYRPAPKKPKRPLTEERDSFGKPKQKIENTAPAPIPVSDGEQQQLKGGQVEPQGETTQGETAVQREALQEESVEGEAVQKEDTNEKRDATERIVEDLVNDTDAEEDATVNPMLQIQ